MRTLTESQEAGIATWIDTLTGGSIEQANGVLEDKWGGMCCLGVAMQCQGHRPWDWYDIDTTDDVDDETGKPGELELSILDPTFNYGLSDAAQQVLAYANDGAPATLYKTAEDWGVGAAKLGVFNPTGQPYTFTDIAKLIPRIKYCDTMAEVIAAIPEHVEV